jgi:paxillin
LCAHCALPIAGRILSAAGERFHPSCFKCHECSINLECVAFYPEPDKKRAERLARIQQRRQGLDVYLPAGVTEEDMWRLEEQDGDESLRFFCGLDLQELQNAHRRRGCCCLWSRMACWPLLLRPVW